MAATRRYLGARTPFGTIVHIENRLYNATVTVEACDGSTKEYRLPFLIAHGLELTKEEQVCPDAPRPSPSSSPSAPDPTHPPLQRHADFDLLLNGKVVGEVYYNMTGYVGTLPQPDGPGITLGERDISAYRAEVAHINREARNNSTRS